MLMLQLPQDRLLRAAPGEGPAFERGWFEHTRVRAPWVSNMTRLALWSGTGYPGFGIAASGRSWGPARAYDVVAYDVVAYHVVAYDVVAYDVVASDMGIGIAVRRLRQHDAQETDCL